MYKYGKELVILCAFLLTGYSSNALAQYSINGLTVTLDNNNWLQVQPMDSTLGLAGCQDSKSCTVDAAGLYRIIDFGPTPAARYDNIPLSAAAACPEPNINDTTADFSGGGGNCYYKMQTTDQQLALTLHGAACEGTGTQLGSCVLESNTAYIVDRWVFSPWGNGGNQISIPAVPRGDASEPGGTGGHTTDLDVSAIHASMPKNTGNGSFLFLQGEGFAENGATGSIQFVKSDNPNTSPNVNSIGSLTLASGIQSVSPLETADSRPPADGEGNFRISCQWSHFAYNDSLFARDVEGGAHLHMYFGKTNADHSTHTANDMVRNGGGSCQGFAYNRSAYWMPALMTGPQNAVVPNEIIVYYKTKVLCPGGHKSVDNPHDAGNTGYACIPNNSPEGAGFDDVAPALRKSPIFFPKDVVKMEQGLQLFSGNPGSNDLTDRSNADGVRGSIRNGPNADVDFFKEIYWACATSGHIAAYFDHIPSKSEMENQCRRGDGSYPQLNATVYFPQCVETNSDGSLKLEGSAQQVFDHTIQMADWENCPDGYATIPRLGILAYWDMNQQRVDNIDSWFLSSDHRDASGNLAIDERGGSLHADWIGGWHDDVQDSWLEECLQKSQNCTYGQTGTPFALHNLSGITDGNAPQSMYYRDASLATEFFIEHGAMLSAHDTHAGGSHGGTTVPPPPPPEPTSVDLIRDGGFEVNNDQLASTPWRISGANQGATATIAWQGRNSDSTRSVLSGNRTKVWHGLWQNVIVPATSDEVEIGQTATLTGYVKLQTGSASSRVRLRVQVRDDRTKWTTHNLGWVDVNGWSWTKVEADWPVNWEGSLRYLRYRIDGVAANQGFRLDDASFVVQ